MGLLSWWRAEVWVNGYGSIEPQLHAVGAWPLVAAVLLLKVVAPTIAWNPPRPTQGGHA